jgi:hypothetical protein
VQQNGSISGNGTLNSLAVLVAYGNVSVSTVVLAGGQVDIRTLCIGRVYWNGGSLSSLGLFLLILPVRFFLLICIYFASTGIASTGLLSVVSSTGTRTLVGSMNLYGSTTVSPCMKKNKYYF